MIQYYQRNVKSRIPRFKSEDEERWFWTTADSTRYLDWNKGKRRKFVRLKRSVKPIGSKSR